MDSNDIMDDKDSGPEVQINFPSSVMSRIEELMGGTEQFDNDEFDAVAYINRVFPTEQSLAGVESAVARCEFRLAGVEHDIRRLVRAQPEQREEGQKALLHAQQCIAELALQVADINKKAERSESMVREITSEIKQLDCAKTNLTAAITALNHLHMLVGGVDSLNTMTDTRQYKEVVLPMQAIMEVLQHFESYREIRELSALREQVHATRAQLAQQILADFKQAFTGGSKSTVSHRTLTEACAVVDILEPRVKQELLDWFINMQLQNSSRKLVKYIWAQQCTALIDLLKREQNFVLEDPENSSRKLVKYIWAQQCTALIDLLKREQNFVLEDPEEYQHLFSAEQESAWIAHIERRYAWLKRHLLAFEDSLAHMFPHNWRLSERIALHFCKLTREDLSSLLAARRNELDVKLLLYAIQKTYNFELLLHKRFTGMDIGEQNLENAIDSKAAFDIDAKETDGDALDRSPGAAHGSVWVGAIGGCFEPYLSLYIKSLDNNLRSFMDRFLQDAKSDAGTGEMSNTGGGAVIASCADLFLFYKRCLVQCARLSNTEPMLELSGVFAKYLREYAMSVLAAALPRNNASMASSSLVSNLQTLLKDDTNHARYTPQELAKITSVITTAEYCLETTVHLEQKLKEKVAPGLADRIDLLPEQDLFHKMITDCIQMLVQDLELAAAPALAAMARTPWMQLDRVGDQSAYVTTIVLQLSNTVPRIRDNLASSRKYFTQFCIRFANSFIPKFIQNIYKCKPISTVGSEQLLLDTHMLKTALLELPSIGSDVKRPPPATYTKVVIKLMTKAEMVLKLVMAPLEGAGDGFVAQFLQLLPDSSLQEFHKVLDMKAVKMSKTQLQALDVLFKETAKMASSDAGK